MKINKKSILVYGIIGAGVVSLILVSVFLSLKQSGKATPTHKISSQLNKPKENKTPVQQKMAIGEVGEVKVKNEATGEEKPLVTPTLPPVIFNASGKIVKVNSNSIVISSSGNSFADGVSRKITCIFTDSTLTFTDNHRKSYKGIEGLKHLKAGIEVLVDSPENIRGKTKFTVKTVNVL